MLLYKNTKLRRRRKLAEAGKIQRVVKALTVSEPIATWQNMAEFSRLPRNGKLPQVATNCLGDGKVIGNAL